MTLSVTVLESDTVVTVESDTKCDSDGELQ